MIKKLIWNSASKLTRKFPFIQKIAQKCKISSEFKLKVEHFIDRHKVVFLKYQSAYVFSDFTQFILNI